MSDSVSLRTAGGLRYAAIDEHLTPPILSLSRLGAFQTKAQTDFWGIGPRFTASPTWKPFNKDFRIFGNVGASFLMEQNEISGVSNEIGFFTMLEASGGIGYTIKGNLFEHWLDN